MVTAVAETTGRTGYTAGYVWHCETHYLCCLAWYQYPGSCSGDIYDDGGGRTGRRAHAVVRHETASAIMADLGRVYRYLPSWRRRHIDVLRAVGPSPVGWRPTLGDLAPPLEEWDARAGRRGWQDWVGPARAHDVEHLVVLCYMTCAILAVLAEHPPN